MLSFSFSDVIHNFFWCNYATTPAICNLEHYSQLTLPAYFSMFIFG